MKQPMHRAKAGDRDSTIVPRATASQSPHLSVAGVNDSAELQARTVAEGHNLFSPNAALPTTDWPATEALHTSGVAERVQRPGGGVPLDPSVEFAMGEQMGHDFGRVRIHADAEAGTMAQQIGANAFTYRNDIYFGAGRFAPDVDRGRSLLAHELTHVAQGGDVVRRDPSAFLPETELRRQDP